MAEKRMFSNKVIETDAFLEMPDSTQNLYFHLSMNADDDGFVAKPKSIMRMTGKKEDDMRLLITKSFIIPFESGVIVIKHWRINNYLRADRYKETIYQEEKQQLSLNAKGEYELGIPTGIPTVDPNKSISNSNTNTNNIYNNTSNEEKGVEKETKSTETQQDIVKSFNFGIEVEAQILKWLEYKKEKKQTYKEIGLKTLLKSLKQDVENKGEQYVIDSITSSIANNYSGIFPAKQAKEPKKDKTIDILHELWEEADKKEKENGKSN